jgi:hypothetical protein
MAKFYTLCHDFCGLIDLKFLIRSMCGAIFLFLRVYIVERLLQWKGICDYQRLILRNEQIRNTYDRIDVTVKSK